MAPARSGRRLALLAGILALVAAASHASVTPTLPTCGAAPQGSDCEFDLMVIPATWRLPWERQCDTVECRAMREVIHVFAAQYGRITPNSPAHDSPRDRDRDQARYARIIQSLGRDHPGRIPLYCRLLTDVARTVNGDPGHDARTIGNLTDLALRLNRPNRSCTAPLRAAFPQTPAVQQAITANVGDWLDNPPRHRISDPPFLPAQAGRQR